MNSYVALSSSVKGTRRDEFFAESSLWERPWPNYFILKLLVFLAIGNFTGFKYQTRQFSRAFSLTTEDKLEYQFYPCASGQVQFRIKAPNDAHIALTTGPHEGEPMYEIFIGGWGNSKSVIRKNRSKPDVAEAETPGVLSADEFRGFWVKWHGDQLVVGKEGDSTPFLSYHDPEPFSIAHFGVCTGWGAQGEWVIEGGKRVKTLNDLKYQFHGVRRGGAISVEIKASSNAHIALAKTKGESSPMYEIMLGGWDNTASVIRYDRKQPDKVRVNTPNLLSASEHKKFSISWLDGRIVVRSGDQRGPVLLEWTDPKPIDISHVGVRTGWGATGNWKLRFEHHEALQSATADDTKIANKSGPRHPGTGTTAPSAPSDASSGSVCWCDASGGMVPPGAVEGGHDDEPLFVGRAHHEGALIPGKVKPGHAVCYIPWGGEEHRKEDYQVLCGCNPRWVPTTGGNVPPNAIPGGETENGEPLFIGRVNHEGTLTIGKVQQSHSVLYIPFGGAEVAFPDYEILVSE